MENKLTEQEFDKIAGKLLNETSKSLNDLRSALFNGSESSSSDEKNEEFLTLKEAEKQAVFCYEYQEGVYDYRIKGKGRTLVEHGKVLIRGADYVYWFAKGVYRYEIIGEGCTLIEYGEVLVEGVYEVYWYAKGVYEYIMEGEDWVYINNNK